MSNDLARKERTTERRGGAGISCLLSGQMTWASVAVALCALLGCDRESSPRAGQALTFEIVDEEIQDSPKSQLRQDIAVSGELTEEILVAFLHARYEDALQREGFRFHERANAVFLYCYDTVKKAELGSGSWVAMLSKTPSGDVPEVQVKTELLELLRQPPEQRHGLTEDQRMLIFRKSIANERRADRDAESRAPFDASNPDSLQAQYRLADQLLQQYQEELAREYGISYEQLREISVEGLTKHWPAGK